MTPERWRRIDDLLHETLKRPASERAFFLDEVCADDVARREIESLISFHEQAQGFLEVPAFEAAADLVCEGQAEEMVGLVIGPYEIRAQLGAGGMGEVYLAQDTKLDRKVAIKFLPPYLEADELAKRRLVKEAKAAAKLDHANICTIYEVVEEASHSLIVMQYVQGETLASRIERAPLETRESINVAMQLADALAEAHSNGIIHRDIKPQNIMITSRLQVKVLDFGLAKILQPAEMKPQSHSQLSAPGMIVGTAAYMSPEQARGDAIDERSDLFSLGVVLYECVAGRRPFAGASPMEICGQVIHLDPPPPSHFDPRVPPELDTLILKALAKDPLARYQSAGELLEALRATSVVLQAEPRTSGNSLLRRLGMSAANAVSTLPRIEMRSRVFVLVMFAVLALALLASYKFLPLGRAKSYQPSSEALRWYNVGTSALRSGTYYDASIALQKATSADDKFPLAHAVLAEAWIELGYADKANQELLRARSLVGNISALPRLEGLYLQAITHVVLREFPSAIENYQAIARETPDSEKAQAYVDLGRVYEKSNQPEKAIESYRKAEKLAPSDVAAFLRLGILYSEREQDTERALEAFKQAEDLYQALRNFEGVTEVFCQRSFLFFDQYRYAEARVQLDKALEITRTTGNKYQEIKALSLLSNVSAVEGHARQAEQQANQAIDAARASGIDNQVTGGFIWLGNIFLRRGEYTDAEKDYKEALELARRDKDNLNEAWALMSLGSLRTLQRNTEEGLRYLEPARLFYQRGGYRKQLSLTLILIGRAYRHKGEYDVALRELNDLLQRGEQANDRSQEGFSHNEIGSLLSVQEQYPEALSHYDESYRINKLLDAQFDLGYSAAHRAGVLWQLGRYEEARAALDEASSIALNPEGNYNQLLASIHVTRACLELSEGHFHQSASLCRQALGLAGTQYKSTAVEATYTLGLARARSGAARDGIVLCEEAIEIAKTTGDPQLLSSALLASAEAMLNGQAQRALDPALQAQESFSRFGQLESEWRAWLVAAQAKQQLGEEAMAREYASSARARLGNLEQKWGRDAYNGYLARQDIQHFRNQVDRILKPQQ